MTNDPECALCLAVSDALSGKALFKNTALAESSRFVVLPSIGPLVLGHVMAVSKEHHFNLAEMGSEAIAEYEELLSSAVKRVPLYGDGLLEVEHGALPVQSSGGCIVHTHVHWIPGLGPLEEAIDHSLMGSHETCRLAELPLTEAPYFLCRRGMEPARIYGASGLETQHLRRVVCQHQGREDEWDWAVFPRLRLLTKTVEIWQ